MRNRFLLLCAAFLGFACPAFAQVDNDFYAGGAVRIGDSATACAPAIEGAWRYNSANKCMDFCDGSDWRPFDCGFCPSSGLVGHWKLNESGNISTAADSAGSNDGTLTNFPADPSANWVAGKLGNALDFDGSDDYVAAGTLNHNIGTGDFTWAAWVMPEALAAYMPIVSNGTFGPGLYARLSNEGAGFGFSWSTDHMSGALLSVGVWQHVIGLRRNGVFEFYVDGTLTPDTSNNTENMSNNTFRIGDDGYSGAGPFNGLIDDVRFYNRALDATEVSALYNGGAACQ